MLNKQQLFFLILLSFSTTLLAQKGTKNPYSVLGIGELQKDSYAPYASMGNVSMAASDSTTINKSNPASYCNFGRHLPIFQIGFTGKFSNFTTETNSSSEQYFGLNQFQLGIPIKKNWGAAIGLKPYAFRGYTVADYTTSDDDDTTAQSINEGAGAISNVFFGVGYRPLNKTLFDTIFKKQKDGTGIDTFYVAKKHQLSIGSNVNYYFGAVTQTRSLEFLPIGYTNSAPYNSRVINSLRMSDFNFEFGLNYSFTKTTPKRGDNIPPKSTSFSFGASYSPGLNLRAYQDLLAYSYQGSFYNGAQIFISDTIQNISNNEGSIYIPEEYKIGFEYRKNPTFENSSSFRFGLDFNYQAWSKYSENFTSGSLNNPLNDRLFVGAGIEYTPVTISGKGTTFFQTLHYRFGINYTQLEYSILNNLNTYEQIDNYGMSFGFGIPLPGQKRSNTNINFGMTLGNLGNTNNGLIREQYMGVFFGVSMTPGYDYAWFRKRLYN